MDQNSLTPLGEQNSLTPYGNNNLNFRLARDQVVRLETAANVSSCVKNIFFLSQGREQKKKFDNWYGIKARNLRTRQSC